MKNTILKNTMRYLYKVGKLDIIPKYIFSFLKGVAESCLLIFLPALMMGNFMVLNLFLALLLNSFNSEELKSRKEVRQNLFSNDFILECIIIMINLKTKLFFKKRQMYKEKQKITFSSKFLH